MDIDIGCWLHEIWAILDARSIAYMAYPESMT